MNEAQSRGGKIPKIKIVFTCIECGNTFEAVWTKLGRCRKCAHRDHQKKMRMRYTERAYPNDVNEPLRVLTHQDIVRDYYQNQRRLERYYGIKLI
jgi:DNA-directed RNA polymerase subunit RPC12/RpoP